MVALQVPILAFVCSVLASAAVCLARPLQNATQPSNTLQDWPQYNDDHNASAVQEWLPSEFYGLHNITRDVDYKYFQEPVFGKYHLAHYDRRFFRHTMAQADTVQSVKDIFFAWAAWADKMGVRYILAHGTLLGWYFGGKMLPWDDDIDLQVSFSTLHLLASHNGTFVDDKRRYVIDVNPHFLFRAHQYHNVIDARIVDTSGGRFLDITGLAYTGEHGGAAVVSCKRPHHYDISAISPLRRTKFEGVGTWVSNDFRRHLTTEYGQASLTKLHFGMYMFNLAARSWVRKAMLPLRRAQVQIVRPIGLRRKVL